jgi:hypothetical protein
MATLYIMSRYRYGAGLALLVAPLVLAACATGGEPSDSTPPAAGDSLVSPLPNPGSKTAQLGLPFRDGSFEVTVTRVETGVRELDVDDAAKSRGRRPWRPTNGQYVVVYLTARNVGNAPAFCSTTDSSLVDDAGRTYPAALLVDGAPPVGQGLSVGNLQPGASASGFITFDVPTSAGAPATLMLQTLAHGQSISLPPTMVTLRR